MNLFTALIALLLMLPTPVNASNAPGVPFSPDAVRELVCADGAQGSAFVIAENTLVTARHVAAFENCVDAETDLPVETYHRDDEHDFALMTMNTKGLPSLRYSCERFDSDTNAYTIGYVGGRLLQSRLIVTPEYSPSNFRVGFSIMPGMRGMRGVLIPGQSGGPVLDEEGVARGLNNVTNYGTEAWSYELADTILCRQ